MQPFQTALKDHLAGTLPAPALLAACRTALDGGELTAATLAPLLAEARAAGLDPTLAGELAALAAATPEADGETRIAAPAEEAGETRLQATEPPAMPPPAPPSAPPPPRVIPPAGEAAGETRITTEAPASGPVSTPPTAATSGTGSSGWTHPEQWEDSGIPVGPGSVLKNRFVLESIIARGGMGVVYKARDLRKEEARDRNPFLAVKVLTEDFRRHPDAFISLQREAKKAQSLAHPNVVTVFDFDRDGATVFMTMELLEGESLSQLLKQIPPGGLEPKRAVDLIDGMALALGYGHKKGIVHSDFKPGNVFITEDGTVKVLDFGIARAIKRPGHEQDVTVFDPGTLGALTPGYASCEMFEGQEPDPRDDIYGLACVAYELFAGRHPFNKLTAVQARDNRITPEAPKRLNRTQWRALQRALAFKRGERTATVEQFMAELKPPRGRGLLVGAVVGLLLLAIAGGGAFLYSRSQNEQVDARFAALDSAIQAGRLAPPASDNATDLLAALAAEGGSGARLEQARSALALAYLSRARAARASGSWDEARRLVAAGQGVKPGANVEDALKDELDQIAYAERNAASQAEEAARQAQVADLHDRFEKALAAMPDTTEGAAEVLVILRDLGSVAPTDPLLLEGRARVAERLARATEAYGQEKHYQEGIAFAGEALKLLPESDALAAARDGLQRAYDQEQAAARAEAARRAETERARQAEAARARQQTQQPRRTTTAPPTGQQPPTQGRRPPPGMDLDSILKEFEGGSGGQVQ